MEGANPYNMRTAVFSALTTLALSGPTFAAGVTYHRDVVPVLQKNCQGCHRPGEAAPMSFLTYKETRPWAKAIKQAVATKKMPPWFADPAHGKFANDRSLSKAEFDTLVAWADSGAPEGNPKDAPKPVAFVTGWNIGKPDVEIEMPNAFEVPASGTLEYQYIVMPGNFKEDTWIQAAEVRPGNRAVVHHVIAFVREPGSKWMRDAVPGVPYVPQHRRAGAGGQPQRVQDDGGGLGSAEFLVGYAPGTVPTSLKPGQAILIKAGSDIVFQMHYTANGKPATDKTKIGLILAKEAPTERVMTLAAANQRFAIPPGDPNYRVDAKFQFHESAKLIGLLPHMHLRGKAFEYRAVYPTGEKETLLNVPRYDFSWQLTYEPAKEIVMPKGSVIEATAWYDNSPNNPANPDPTAEVRFGDQSWEEMMFGFFTVAFDAKMSPRDLYMPKKRPAQQAGAGE